MCATKRESFEKITNNFFEIKSDGGFWDINLGDFANLLLALTTVVLSIYVFIYQRSKDRSDQKLMVGQIKSSVKLEMYKILILEPNVENLHNFFQSIQNSLNTLQNIQISNALMNQFQTILDTSCNDFEGNFIELLNGIDPNFQSNILEVMDTFRDGISDQLANATIGAQVNYSDFQNCYNEFKSNFISALYNFENLDLPTID